MTGGKSARDKGGRGESEARDLLRERDYEVLETSRGRSNEDIIAAKNGVTYSVEVKWQERWDLKAWRKQCRENARKRKTTPMLLVRITAWPHTFYVERGDEPPCVWRGRC